MNDPLNIALAAKLFLPEVEAPPPLTAFQETVSSFVGLLALPLLLLLVAALAGGLRTLLGSPLRSHLLANLPEPAQERLERLSEARPTLATSAGLVRVLLVFAAVFVMVLTLYGKSEGEAEFTGVTHLTSWIALTVLGGLLLEGLPALAAHAHGLRLVLLALPLVRLLDVPLRPFSALISSTVRGITGSKGQTQASALAADMLGMVRDSDREEHLQEIERRMISRIMDLPDTDAAEVMTPRTSLVAIQAGASIEEAVQLSVREGHSRIPVYEENLDQVTGVFYVKDVLDLVLAKEDLANKAVREVMREPFFVPETMRVPALFDEMRRRRLHMAVVVDEYGGTAGVVTVEDLLEEIVGEIQDEHDPQNEEIQIEHLGPGELLVDGGVNVADLNEVLGSLLPEEDDYDTVAGLLFDRFGHIPAQGETLAEDGVVLEVVQADDRRIQKVRVTRKTADSDDEA